MMRAIYALLFSSSIFFLGCVVQDTCGYSIHGVSKLLPNGGGSCYYPSPSIGMSHTSSIMLLASQRPTTTATTSSEAATVQQHQDQPSRRRALQFVAVVAASLTMMPSKTLAAKVPPSKTNEIEACRPNALNCIRTEWIPPKGTSKEDAIQTLRYVLQSYPMSGQNGVDCNGWNIVEDRFDNGSKNTARVEYKSCVGPAAITVNFGQPFIDDLKIQIIEKEGIIVVQVRSSSRKGSSDLGVNRKRVLYLSKALSDKGWTVGDPRYEPDWYIGNQ